MYVVVYNIVFAMRNESTIINGFICSYVVLLFYIAMSDPTFYLICPREDAGDVSREYVLRIPSVSLKATKWAPLYSHSRWYGVKQ